MTVACDTDGMCIETFRGLQDAQRDIAVLDYFDLGEDIGSGRIRLDEIG
jgi:hypothetical protein